LKSLKPRKNTTYDFGNLRPGLRQTQHSKRPHTVKKVNENVD